MGGNRQMNSFAIRRGFDKLKDAEERIAGEGMVRLAKSALEYLVKVHNEHAMFMMHTMETNTMAYAVGHDGLVYSSGFHDGVDYTDVPGEAETIAKGLIHGTRGWVATIVSEMEGWYRFDLEIDFLEDVAFNTLSDFQTYFKRIH